MRTNILIIDDDQSIHNMFKWAIDRSRYTVIPALVADEGILKAEIREPELIFLKRKMPRSDMGDLLRQLYRNLKDVPVFIMIEEGDDTLEIDKAIKKGFDCRICKKPFTSSDIENIINDVFSEERTIRRERITA